MATNAEITAALMDEAGKTSKSVERAISTKVADITLELLTQSEGRFKALSRTQTISVESEKRAYKVNSDFNTAKGASHEIDSDGNFVGRIIVLSEEEVYERLSSGGNVDERMAFIKFYEMGPDNDSTANRGYYYVLSEEPTGSHTFLFAYYRRPTEADTDTIRKPSIIKHGVRAAFANLFPAAELEAKIYLSMLSGFKESPHKYVTDIIITPAKRVADYNKRMYTIGKGG